MILFYFHAMKVDCNFDVLPKCHINGAYSNKECNNLVKSLKNNDKRVYFNPQTPWWSADSKRQELSLN